MRLMLFVTIAAATALLAGHAMSMPFGQGGQVAIGASVIPVHTPCHSEWAHHQNSRGPHHHYIDPNRCMTVYGNAPQRQPNIIIRPEFRWDGNRGNNWNGHNGGSTGDFIFRF